MFLPWRSILVISVGVGILEVERWMYFSGKFDHYFDRIIRRRISAFDQQKNSLYHQTKMMRRWREDMVKQLRGERTKCVSGVLGAIAFIVISVGLSVMPLIEWNQFKGGGG